MRDVSLSWPGGSRTFRLASVEDWSAVADAIRPLLVPGMVLALDGPLGAGKTTFSQILAASLGVVRELQSPTFALMRSYPVPGAGAVKRIIHVDAYRIEHLKEWTVLDLDEELADGRSVLLLEWPENLIVERA
jgi:tRNA threonylcarbamoyl adenosine modification protein YjeE